MSTDVVLLFAFSFFHGAAWWIWSVRMRNKLIEEKRQESYRWFAQCWQLSVDHERFIRAARPFLPPDFDELLKATKLEHEEEMNRQ